MKFDKYYAKTYCSLSDDYVDSIVFSNDTHHITIMPHKIEISVETKHTFEWRSGFWLSRKKYVDHYCDVSVIHIIEGNFDATNWTDEDVEKLMVLL